MFAVAATFTTPVALNALLGIRNLSDSFTIILLPRNNSFCLNEFKMPTIKVNRYVRLMNESFEFLAPIYRCDHLNFPFTTKAFNWTRIEFHNKHSNSVTPLSQ